MDFDVNEALAMQKDVSPYMWEVCNSLSHNYKNKNTTFLQRRPPLGGLVLD